MGFRLYMSRTPFTAEELKKARLNKHMQENNTAGGFHVLHFIESEMRRSNGEGFGPCCYDIRKRVALLSPVWTKFTSARKASTAGTVCCF